MPEPDRAREDQDRLAAAYDAARPRLVGVAYAILGSRAEAEDVVADCWLRLVAADEREPVRDVLGWGTVAVARAATDVLRSARVRRETYVGPWLPEPVVSGPLAPGPWGPGWLSGSPSGAGADPLDRVTLDDSVRWALLVVLEQLSPAERTAWVLHDLFEMPFAEVAAAVGRTPSAVRQLASRARRHVAAGVPRVQVDPEDHARTVEAFVAAAAGGDLAGLVALLDPDAVLITDGGGVVSAARRPVLGADRVARFLLGLAERRGLEVQPVRVNGDLGIAAWSDGRPDSVLAFTVVDGRIARVDIVRAPEKLRSTPSLPA